VIRAVLILTALAIAASPAHAQLGPKDPAARMQLEGRDAYAGMPFGVAVVAEGFDEGPTPAQPALSIPGATVTPLGAEPQVQRISINGRRYDTVTWVFRWRVEVARAGSYEVGAVTVVQGTKKAVAAGGQLNVTEIAATDDMRIEVQLPERPIWLGEVVTAEIHWLLRRDVHDQTLSVPLLSMPGELSVTAPPITNPREVLAFAAGATDLELPYRRDQVKLGSSDFVRFRFQVQVTPLRAGAIEIAPAQVVASLEVGRTRDQFGFPTARTQLFRATDVARTLDVRPLPQTGRPRSFAGAVGSSFSIATRTSRSVVQLGEPVDLEITVKGDARLDGLTLGPLSGPGRLPVDAFAAPDAPPPGELTDDGLTKVFRVPVQVTDPATTEIPPIELAWFDPASGQYRTTRSEPIALSIKGGSVIGAGQVVATRRPGDPGAAPTPGVAPLVDADLALSAPGAALGRTLTGPLLWAVVAALYLVPLGLFMLRAYQRRTAARREEAGEATAARRKLAVELERARTAPARDVAGSLVAALRHLARVTGGDADDPVVAKIETEAFAPSAADRPLAEPVRAEAEAAARRWGSPPRRPSPPRAAALVLLGVVGGAAEARAGARERVDEGRAAYQEAMAATDPTVRQASFARAEAAFRAAAAERPDSPELLADWGNAALGASDFGTATLAYRRALRVDPDHGRARSNLGWLRGRLPDNLRPRDGGATATLLFFHGWTRDSRLLGGAIAFALAVLLIVPWRGSPGYARRVVAVVPAAIWMMLTASLVLGGGRDDDGVVVAAQLLRSADNPGAPAAMSSPLPPGAEVSIVERRAGWIRIRTAGGATGWLPAAAVAAVRTDGAR
jgi:cytochrome c-type biogenesis protein CcmH/NrfG